MRSDKISKYLGTGGAWQQTFVLPIIHDLSSSPSSLCYTHSRMYTVPTGQSYKFQLLRMRFKSYERSQPCNTMPKWLFLFGQVLK